MHLLKKTMVQKWVFNEFWKKILTLIIWQSTDALGTCVLFEEGQTKGKVLYSLKYVHLQAYVFKDSVVMFALHPYMFFMENQDHVPELKYTCHTVKKLMMQRIFLTEKKECESSEGQPKQLLTHYYDPYYYDKFGI